MTRHIIRIALALIVGGLLSAGAAAQEAEPEISPIAGNLYRLRVGDRHTVFLTTTRGIVLVDPLSVETAQWLKPELGRRFPPGVVRYVLHTSHRVERSEGASIFNDTAELVGHREFNEAVSRARHAQPLLLPAADDAAAARLMRANDRNGDGRVTGGELYARVHDIEAHFDDKRVISIGGRTVEIIHAAIPGAPENAIVSFPAERVAFAATAPPIDTAPFTFAGFTPHELQDWLNAALASQFDVLILGDGRSIRRDQLAKAAAYVNDLITRVAAEYESGTSAAHFGDAKMPASFKSDPMFREWRANVTDAYQDVSVFRIDATVGGLADYVQPDSMFCQSSATCSTGGIVSAVTGSLSGSFGRFAMVGELIASEEAFSSRTSRFYDEEFALRETRVAVMARYNVPAGFASYRFLGGLSYAVANRAGIARIKEGFAPFAGRHPIESRDSRWAVTGGLDLVMGRRVGIVIPLRVNYAVEEAKGTWPSRIDAQAGVALTVRLVRRID